MDASNSQMRVGFLVVKSLFCGGGIETYTYEVGKRLVARGHDVTVFSMGHYGDVPSMVDGMHVIRIPCLRGAALERLSASMSAIAAASLVKPRITIMHLQTPMTGAFGSILHAFGIPTVVQMHGIDWKRSRWGPVARTVIRNLERAVMWYMPTCTAVSQTQCDFYEKQYGRRLTFIPPGVNVPHESLESDELVKIGLRLGKYILFTSRLVPEKGAHYLISAFRNLRTDYRLVIAGGDLASGKYAQGLRNLAGGDARIVFPGFVQGRLKNQLLRHASIYVQPSEIEGLSIALLEAMSYGLTSLVSDIPENIEAIGNAGMTFESRNEKDLSLKLEQLLADEALCVRLGSAARNRVFQKYSWDRVTDELEHLYSTVVSRGMAPEVGPIPVTGLHL